MGSKYCQLTELQRVMLGLMLRKGFPKSRIAANLGVHRSTIYREIKRNSWKSINGEVHYTAMNAQKKYIARRGRLSRLICDFVLRHYVEDKLNQGWSPWQIEGRLKISDIGIRPISHETIYRYIYSDYSIRNKFYKKLRRKHFHRVKKGSRKSRFPKEMKISNRPQEIASRESFGHWEADLMIFKRGVKSNLITLRERKTRFIIAIKNEDKTASGTAINIVRGVQRFKNHIKSITFDQGSEFMQYPWISDCLGAEVYFCDPASPYQKGCVENGNGVIRVEFPRSINLDETNGRDVKLTIEEINNRPMKCLSYQTPLEAFKEQVGC